jgi:hypothetical protein
VRRIAAAALAVGMSAICAGPASASTQATTKWARDANRICAAELVQIHALPRPVADYLPEAQYLDRAASIVGAATTALAKLPPPSSSRAAIGRWIALEWQGVRLVRQMAAAFRAHDLASVQSVGSTVKQRGAQADAIAIRLGAAICAKS